MLEGVVIGAAVVVWGFALALHRRRTDRRARTLNELVGHRVTLGVAIRGSSRFIIPVIATIASVDRAREWLFVEVIGVDLTADSNYAAQAPDSYLSEIAHNGMPFGFVRSIEVDEVRLRW